MSINLMGILPEYKEERPVRQRTENQAASKVSADTKSAFLWYEE